MNQRETTNSNKVHEFDPLIYPRKLWVTVGCSTQDLKDMFDGCINDMDDCYAYTVNVKIRKLDNRGGVLIRFGSRKDLSTQIIAHESVHAAMNIFDYVDAVADTKNQEPLAYLVGWVADCINQVKTGKFKK